MTGGQLADSSTSAAWIQGQISAYADTFMALVLNFVLTIFCGGGEGNHFTTDHLKLQASLDHSKNSLEASWCDFCE